jgi:hypothetical protein
LPDSASTDPPSTSSSGGSTSSSSSGLSSGSTGSTSGNGSSSGRSGSSGTVRDAAADATGDVATSSSSSSTGGTDAGCTPDGGTTCGNRCNESAKDSCGNSTPCSCRNGEACTGANECCKVEETGAGKCGSLIDPNCQTPVQGLVTCVAPDECNELSHTCECKPLSYAVACMGKCDDSTPSDGCGGTLPCSQAAVCVGANEVCNKDSKTCCSPQLPGTRCTDLKGRDLCGMATNNCGETVDCGACVTGFCCANGTAAVDGYCVANEVECKP